MTRLEIARLLCEKSLYRFVRLAWPVIESAPFIDNWHIGFVCEHLQAVTTGQIPKLLINIPPGCSKSLLTSVLWPAWEWSIDPAIRWFCASYDQRLSTRDSVKCRSILTSEWYRQMWPEKVRFRNDQDQKTYYETLAGGWRLATSIGGHGTGEHPDRIIVDDPHDAKGAESEAERTSVNEWWDLTMSTRGTSRNARRVIIMQRLNEDDLSGHVLGEGDWVHLCLPMRYEKDRMKVTPLGKTDPRTVEGELLTPKQFDEKKVSAMERSMGSYGTSGQFQQRPSPAGGDFFKLPWFKIVDASPAKGHRVRYWDKSGSSGKGDYSAGVLMLMAEDGLYYIEDVVRGQWSAHERNRIMAQTAAMDHDKHGGKVALWMEQEPGSGGKESAEISVRELAGFDVHAEPVSGQGDKKVRARPFAAQCEAGNVRIVRGAWNKAYIDELCIAKGEKIATIRGDIPVQDVIVGDLVATRMGWMRVARSEQTQVEADVCEIRMGDGRTLVTTPNHPILVMGCGFKPAGLLAEGDVLLRFTGEMSFTATRNREASISVGGLMGITKNCIGVYGRARLVQCQEGITFTTGTGIPKITLSQTLSASRRQITSITTERDFGARFPSPKHVRFAEMNTRQLDLASRLLVQKYAAISCNSSEETRKFTTASARGAALDFAPGTTLPFFAPLNVPPSSFKPKGDFPSSLASGASQNSSPWYRRFGFAADVAVYSVVMLQERRPVYNLEVEGCHEFVANGILVHNCVFPNGKNDDQVDGSSGAFNKLILNQKKELMFW